MRPLSHAILLRRVLLPALVLPLLLMVAAASVATPARAQQQGQQKQQEPRAEAPPRFLPDDPIAVDPDRLDMPAPMAVEASGAGDYIANTFFSPADYNGPARNANTLEEVPNSSWYTRRHYHRRMSLEALRRGPNPATDSLAGLASGPWTVVSAEQGRRSVAVQVEDRRGGRYLLTFDPPGHAELATGAGAVATKLFHALGYHVPESYVVAFEPGRLELGEEAGLSREELRALLRQTARYADGRYRALANKLLEGTPIGPFQYYGTRPDDGNDVFPHESRRELRGMRVFAAWLNYVGARGANSLDTVVEGVSPLTGDSAQYVRHHLTGFGAALGAGPRGPKGRWQGYEYALEPGRMLLRAASFGFAGAPWNAIDYPDYPAAGHFGAEPFDPVGWKPLYPNPAFRRMDAADAFWAARQVMHFTGEELRAIVETGRYTDPETATYLAETLAKRRDKIGRAYLGYGGGLDRFRAEKDSPAEDSPAGDSAAAAAPGLVFVDLLARHGFGPEQRARRVTWRVFDNEQGTTGRVLKEETTRREALALPAGASAPFLVAEIETPAGGAGAPATTRAYLRREEGTYSVVGLDRSGEVPIRK